MYLDKQGGRPSALSQSKDVLRQALSRAPPRPRAALSEVAELADAVARRLGLPDAQVAEVRLAAELHDVGKVAIPEAILDKPGPLDEKEWAFMRRHTLIGERIVARGAGARGRRADRALEPRAHRRRRLPGRPRRAPRSRSPRGSSSPATRSRR